MIGIQDVALYVPRWRLQREALTEAWGQARGRGERPVAGPDEDALTLAVAAARCLGAREHRST